MLARETFEAINLCGEHDAWWDGDFILIPKPN
jgi:hypothetical protein